MKLTLPAADTAKRLGAVLLVIIIAGAILIASGLLISRLLPRHDPAPIVTARQDERKAAEASAAIGNTVATQARDSAVHVDITTKEIRDAFDAPPPAHPAPTAGAADLPPAPVDSLRERLNESIARANRAAGPATDPG